jgi:oxalate decarboxylase
MGSNETQAPHHETPTLGNPDLPQEGMENITGDPAHRSRPVRVVTCR